MKLSLRVREGLYVVPRMAQCRSLRTGSEDFVSFAYETEIVTYDTFPLLALQSKNKPSPDELSSASIIDCLRV